METIINDMTQETFRPCMTMFGASIYINMSIDPEIYNSDITYLTNVDFTGLHYDEDTCGFESIERDTILCYIEDAYDNDRAIEECYAFLLKEMPELLL